MKSKIKIFIWLPALLMMVIIFRFSTADGEQSSGLSLGLTQHIVDTVICAVNIEMTPEEELSFIELIHTPIRKLGYLSEYGMLAVTVVFPLYAYHRKRRWKLFIWCEGICIFYAGSDEFHQLFVPERSGQLRDVLIDSTGITLGLLFFFLCLKIFHNHLSRRLNDPLKTE
ncbi:MAG: VanZ family protein [Anaerocolumna sp.]